MPNAADEERRTSSLLRPVLIAVAVQALLSAATTAAKLRAGRDDTDLYDRYASLTLEGKVPYRDFPMEYPPMALPLFLAARLVAREVGGFKVAFAVEMLAFNAATVGLVAGWVRRRSGPEQVRNRLARYTILYLLLSRLMVSRYDAAAMFAGFAAAIGWSSGRQGVGGLAAGLGALLKVYPALIAIVAAPGDLARSVRSRSLGLIVFASTIAIGAIAWLAIGTPRGVAGSLRYQLGRGFEFGSVWSGLQMLAAKAVGAEIAIVRDRAAWASVTPWTPRLLALAMPIQAVAVLAVVVIFMARGRVEGVRYSGAAILAFIVAGKVFSPQYLIWLLPFIVVLEGPIAARGFRIFAAGCAATLVAPALVQWFPRDGLVVILAYNLKNALFLALLALLTVGPAGRSRGLQAPS